MKVCIGCGSDYIGNCGCGCSENIEDREDYCSDCKSAPCRCDEEYERRREE